VRRAGQRLLVAAALLGACGEPALKQAGEPCVAGAECAAGLVCDLAAAEPVCAGHLTTDARVIDAGADAAAIDAGGDAAIDAAPDAAIDAP
jgi:hypothetical protein